MINVVISEDECCFILILLKILKPLHIFHISQHGLNHGLRRNII